MDVLVHCLSSLLHAAFFEYMFMLLTAAWFFVSDWLCCAAIVLFHDRDCLWFMIVSSVSDVWTAAILHTSCEGLSVSNGGALTYLTSS